jgi:eukaryotic-like serine/threonine-protein kinase
MTDATIDPLRAALADRYRLERELGRGGMATVYLAQDLKHDRPVALKMLLPELSAVIGVKRFLQEIKVTAGLQHPNILPLFDSGEAGGQVYYVMPYVEGESLRTRLTRERQLPIAEAVRIGREVARGLDYAHRRGVIHRDIKPENILLGEEGQALVADFGIARALSAAGGTRITETGLSLGTPAYMSPEQATAAPEVDARSDVYSLGAVLYEMLTGEPPHSGASVQAIVAKLLTERPTRPRTVRDAVPEPLDAAVMTALAKTPADRYATAKEFAEAIAAPTAAVPPVISRGRRTWPLVAAVAAVSMIAVLLLVGRRTPQPSHEPSLRPLTTTGKADAPTLSPDGRMVAYISEGSRLLVQDLAGGGEALALISDASDLGKPQWSPDGATLFFLGRLKGGAAGVFAVPRLGGTPRLVANANVAFAVHPKGDHILLSHFDATTGGLLTLARLSDGITTDTLLRVPAPPSGLQRDWSDSLPFLIDQLEWSPDGRWIAFTCLRRTQDWWGLHLCIMSAEGKIVSQRREMVYRNIQWSPGSDAIYYFPDHVGAELDLVRLGVDRRTGRFRGDPVVILSRVPGLGGSISLAADGRTAAYIVGTPNAHIWTRTFDPRTGKFGEGRQVTSGTAWHGTPTIAADGRTIAYAKGDHLGDNIYAGSFETTNEAAVTSTGDFNHDPSLSPSGTKLIFNRVPSTRDRLSLLLSTVPGGIPQSVAARDVFRGPPPHLVRWVSDSSVLFAAGMDNRHFVVQDLTTGMRRELTLPDSFRVGALMAFNPGGADESSPIAPVTSPDRDGVAVAAAVGGRQSIYRGSLSRPGWTLLTGLPSGEQAYVSRWTTDGWIYIVHWAESDTLRRLSRVRASGGSLQLNVPVPPGCALSPPKVSLDFRRMVCSRATRPTWDVWLAEDFDPAGH